MKVKQYYDEKSEDYDADKSVSGTLYSRVYDIITWKYLEPYLPASSDELVLDAGGGTGKWAIPMAKKGCKVVLLDISEGMLNAAKRKIENENLQDLITLKKGISQNWIILTKHLV